MKKRLCALLLVLAMVPAVVAFAADGGYAESLMNGTYAVIGGDQSLTIRSHVDPGGQGGYCQALYAAELTGEETKAELDALALELVRSGAEPLWGGGKHCYHGGDYTVDPEYTLKASERQPGTYLYVCYAFGCAGGNYNHILTPYYEKISTMAVRVTEKAETLELHYALADGSGRQIASFEAGDEVEVDLNAGALYLQLLSDTEYPTERITAVKAEFPENQAADPFAFDEKALLLTPLACGSGSITVTIESYLGGTAPRTETVWLTYPCAPEAELTVLEENSCTEEGLTAYLCYGYGRNCETVFDEQILPPAGHQPFSVSQVIEKPTATQPGLGMGTCRVCGAIGVEVEIPPIFSDVVSDGYYSQPLDYCYEAGLVTGVTENTFAPNNACLRAQVVTFLWRAEGCPEPESTANPFVDVAQGSFYYKAVLWAVENGITTGTDATHFSPNAVCNRAQVVTFLHRAFGSPEPQSAEQPFTDVQAGSWYEQAVLWAVEEGITSGLTASTFGPTANCSRAQIVTFLYRAYAE